MRRALACLLPLLLAAPPPPSARRGPPWPKRAPSASAPHRPEGLPERYRLAERAFSWEMDTKLRLPAIGVTVHRVRFPSPVKTRTPENNTVHAEYYRPDGKGPFPPSSFST